MMNPKEEENKEKPTANDVKCWDSDGSTPLLTKRLEEMFVKMGQKQK